MKSHRINSVIKAIRVPFLVLTPVCVLLGASIAVANDVALNYWLLTLTLVGALLAHISVNALNEYFDFKSGLDLITKRTKFSGGSGALPERPEMVDTIFFVGVGSLVATLLIGCYFVFEYGTGIVPIGLAGLVLIVIYTDWVNRHPLICLLAPGFGFGFLMVVGTQYVLQGEYAQLSWIVALIPFFLVNNLLLLNQYPDAHADAKSGRYHFVIAYGVVRSGLVYGLFTLATVLALVSYVLIGYLPVLSLIALLPMPLAFYSLYGALTCGEAIGSSPKYLAANVAVTILTPLLLAISIIAGT